MMPKFPDGWKDRAEWQNGQVFFTDADADLIRIPVKIDLKNEAIPNEKLYGDCGELNTTALVESYGDDHHLNVDDPVTRAPALPEQLYDWAIEISQSVEYEWERSHDR